MKVEIRADAFKNKPADLGGKLGGNEMPLEHFEGFEYPPEGGILSKYKVYRFPTKGIPIAPALIALGTVKKIILYAFDFLGISPVRYFVGLAFFLPKKLREKMLYHAIKNFMFIADWTMNQWYLEPDMMCTMAREVHFKVKQYIMGLELPDYKERLWLKLLCVLCHVLEYDSAYRYRAQDILMAVDKVALRNNPGKEVARLLKVAMTREREGGITPEKYASFAWAISVFFRFRNYGQVLADILDEVDTSGLSFVEFRELDFPTLPTHSDIRRTGFDHADWYHCLSSYSYDFGGTNFGDRFTLKKKINFQWVETLQKSPP